MDPRDIIDLGREAIWIALLVAAPVLLTGMIVGLLVGLLQALTQIQEQTVAFVPKIVAMVLASSRWPRTMGIKVKDFKCRCRNGSITSSECS